MGAKLDTILNFWMLVDSGRVAELENLVTPDVQFKSRGVVVGGLQEILPFWQGTRTAFPDLRRNVLDYLETDDAVAVEIHASGTNTGPLSATGGQQIPPTGRPVTFESIDLIRFEGDRIKTWNDQHDQLQLMQQLGMLG